MRVHVVSDVHGQVDALARAGDGADALVVLGDLLLYVDYSDPRLGIFADLFGAEAAHEFAVYRRDRRFDDLHALTDRLFGREDPMTLIRPAAIRQYKSMFDVLPTPSYLTYGNVDIPALWPQFARPGVSMFDGEVAEIGGWRFGFVGGWPRRLPPNGRRPFLDFRADCTPEAYAEKIAAVGDVDVLCCHVPPAIAELRYDTVARGFEMASEAFADAIRATQPRYALYGHVHQPLQQRMRIGRTECINVGHFRGSGTPFALTW